MSPSFIGYQQYNHNTLPTIGVLLVNLGTPKAPTPTAVYQYLKQFLSDGRVIELPRFLWWLILNGFILPTRPQRVAKLYANIWTEKGSPLLAENIQQQQKLQAALHNLPVMVELAMTYGEPSINYALEKLRHAHCRYLLILPLYPQYAGSTTGAVFDGVMSCLTKWRWVPHLQFISDYCSHHSYIQLLAKSIANYQYQHGKPDKLIFSFHGTPLEMLLKGDPYHCLCHKTARLVSEQLKLNKDQWLVTFQSRFGPSTWLKPYTDETLKQLSQSNVYNVQVVCPAFCVDCLETLEEIADENKKIFLNAGGKQYQYIPALNASDEHVQFFYQLITNAISQWLPKLNDYRHNAPFSQQAYENHPHNKIDTKK